MTIKSFQILRKGKMIYLFLISALYYSCQEKNKKAEVKKIEIGVVDSVFSNTLNEQRKIWVHVPKSEPYMAQEKKYPVVYLLDGDGHFSSVVGMIEQLSSVNGNTACPEMIVVGIPNTDRTRDLTTSIDTTVTSGGAENFTKFIETELIPYIDKSYPTTNHRIIIGHSLGGLFVINALLNHPNLFSNYVAIDPSLWWDNGKLLHQAAGQLRGEKYKNKSLFLGIANNLKPGMKLSDVPSDTSSGILSRHMRSLLEFVKTTNSNNDGSLIFDSKYYENDSHGSIPLIATYDALRFFYSWYELKHLGDYYGFPISALEYMKNHYIKASEKIGYNVFPPESLINSIGYDLIQDKKYDNGFAFFKMNIDNYPTSANAFGSMGDCYLNKGDTLQAIANFEKALSIAPVPNAKEKLDKLKKEKNKN